MSRILTVECRVCGERTVGPVEALVEGWWRWDEFEYGTVVWVCPRCYLKEEDEAADINVNWEQNSNGRTDRRN